MVTGALRHKWRAWLAVAAAAAFITGIVLSLRLSQNGQYKEAAIALVFFQMLACILLVGWFLELKNRGSSPLSATSILPTADWYPRLCTASLQRLVRTRKRSRWVIGLILAWILLHDHLPVFSGSFERLPYVVDGRISAPVLALTIAGTAPMALFFVWVTIRYDHLFRLHFRWMARRHDAFRDPEVVEAAQELYDRLRLERPLPLRHRSLE